MADNIIQVNVTANKPKSVTVSSANIGTEIIASSDTGRFWAQTSKNWAVSEALVDNTDYSSKYYANKASQSATRAQNAENAVRENYNSFLNASVDANNEIQIIKEESLNDLENAKDKIITDINNTKTTILSDIEFVADGEKKEIQGLVDDEKEEIKDLASEIKNNAEDIINRVGISMFDTILKDHVLTYEESKGLALQGTYVYKEALAGTRYGYPDFYNKCLEEYSKAVQDIQTWTQPVLNANGMLGGATYACISSSSEGSSFPAYQAFDGDSSTRWSPSSRTLPQYLDFYTPEAIVPSSVYIDFYAANEAYSAGIIQGSNNGESWDDLGSFTGNSNQTINVELIAEKAYKYIRFYATGLPTGATGTYGKVAEIKISATVRHPYKKYSNGHLFYDIADKEAIDKIFEETGSAWMYGIDTENERVFLPRDKYFAVTGGVMGNGMTLGLVNSATNFVGLGLSNNTGVNSYTGNYGVPIGTSNTGSTGDSVNQGSAGITTDPTKSGIVLESDSSKYLYICVGNTTSYEGITEVVSQGLEILEQVNQGINQGLESRVMLDGSNAEFPHIIETYENGTSRYRIWSPDSTGKRWCEQWGKSSSNTTTTLLKSYEDDTFTVLANLSIDSQYYSYFTAYATGVDSFYVRQYNSTATINWYTCGYLV